MVSNIIKIEMNYGIQASAIAGFQVMSPGSGANPTNSSKVTVMYKGTLLEGTVFDSTADTTTADPFCHGIRMRRRCHTAQCPRIF
jgi:FKBP-type peptidyl-prolyl cis-trans isomerase